jgi:hypothetical protein
MYFFSSNVFDVVGPTTVIRNDGVILIAALVLASAAAQAGSSRNLTMASNDPPAVAEAKGADEATERAAVEAPKFVERPAAVETKAEEPTAEPAKPVAEKDVRNTES